MAIKRYIAYLKYVLKHKLFVFQECRKLNVSLWRALIHDLDKFLPDEFFPYAECFYKEDGSKQYNETAEFNLAWVKHQHRNDHHWQWWVNAYIPYRSSWYLRDRIVGFDTRKRKYIRYHGVMDDGHIFEVVDRTKVNGLLIVHKFDESELPDMRFVADEMSDQAKREMLADWRGAGRALGNPDTKSWYLKNRTNIILGVNTRLWIESQLGIEDKDVQVS